MNQAYPDSRTLRKTERDDERALHLVYLLMPAIVLAASFIMSTDGALNSVDLFGLKIPVRIPCIFKFFTGFNCPACGMTRCFIYMSHLNLERAFEMNHAGVLLYALCVFEVPYRAAMLIFGHIPLQQVLKIFELSLFIAFVVLDIFFFLWQFTVLI